MWWVIYAWGCMRKPHKCTDCVTKREYWPQCCGIFFDISMRLHEKAYKMYWLWNWEEILSSMVHVLTSSQHSFVLLPQSPFMSVLSVNLFIASSYIASPYPGGGHLQNRYYSRKFVRPWASSIAKYLLWEQHQYKGMSSTTSCPSIFLSWSCMEWVNALDATHWTSATTIMDGGLGAVVSPSRESI